MLEVAARLCCDLILLTCCSLLRLSRPASSANIANFKVFLTTVIQLPGRVGRGLYSGQHTQLVHALVVAANRHDSLPGPVVQLPMKA